MIKLIILSMGSKPQGSDHAHYQLALGNPGYSTSGELGTMVCIYNQGIFMAELLSLMLIKEKEKKKKKKCSLVSMGSKARGYDHAHY